MQDQGALGSRPKSTTSRYSSTRSPSTSFRVPAADCALCTSDKRAWAWRSRSPWSRRSNTAKRPEGGLRLRVFVTGGDGRGRPRTLLTRVEDPPPERGEGGSPLRCRCIATRHCRVWSRSGGARAPGTRLGCSSCAPPFRLLRDGRPHETLVLVPAPGQEKLAESPHVLHRRGNALRFQRRGCPVPATHGSPGPPHSRPLPCCARAASRRASSTARSAQTRRSAELREPRRALSKP